MLYYSMGAQRHFATTVYENRFADFRTSHCFSDFVLMNFFSTVGDTAVDNRSCAQVFIIIISNRKTNNLRRVRNGRGRAAYLSVFAKIQKTVIRSHKRIIGRYVHTNKMCVCVCARIYIISPRRYAQHYRYLHNIYIYKLVVPWPVRAVMNEIRLRDNI
jgi:hypothetical protein